ncbi:hypothetical protein C0992_007426 [Termitomyces sp. T32_za158]|nr:hypothetical protein C0992_007426 [Termitomyces sp. T32_za158]
MGGPVQYADMTQGSALAHRSVIRADDKAARSELGHSDQADGAIARRGACSASDEGEVEEEWQGATGGAQEPGKVPDLASALDSSDEEEDGRSLLTLSVQLQLVLDRFPTVTKELTQKRLQLYVVKHLQLMADRGQHVPKADSTEYIELFARIFELELNEYIKCKTAQGTTTSTATPAESVDYDALLHQCAPDITEAMDILNAPKQANESQQDYEKRQNAAQWQANTSGMPRQALSEVETATSNFAGEDEANTLPEDRTPRQHIMIKEEECNESIPDEPVTPRRVAR